MNPVGSSPSIPNHGLRFTLKDRIVRRYDPRRFSRKKRFGAFFDTAAIPDFDVAPDQTIHDQLASFLCTAYANTTVSEIQEGVALSPEYAYQKTNVLMRTRHSQGANPDAAMKAHVKFGCIEEKDSPYSLARDGQYKVEDPANWSGELDLPAAAHKKKSYMRCDEGSDVFDSVLIALWSSHQKFLQTGNRSDIRAVSLGFAWLPEFQFAPRGVIPNVSRPPQEGSGHNVVARGKKTVNGVPCLVIQNSYGENVGDRGLYYFPREIVNRYAKFADTFEDLDPNEEKKNQWGLIAKLLDKLVELLKSLSARISVSPPPPPPVLPAPAPETPSPLSRWEQWRQGKGWMEYAEEGRREAFKMATRVCDEEGLPAWLRWELLCTIQGESGYNVFCVNENKKDGKVWSIDYGIAQLNTKYYLSYYNMTGEDAFRDPEKCVRIMAEAFRLGRADDWIAHRGWKNHENETKKLDV